MGASQSTRSAGSNSSISTHPSQNPETDETGLINASGKHKDVQAHTNTDLHPEITTHQDAPPSYTPTPAVETKVLRGTFGSSLTVSGNALINEKISVGSSMTCLGDLTIEDGGRLQVGSCFNCAGNVWVGKGARLSAGSWFEAVDVFVDIGAVVSSGSGMQVRKLSGTGKISAGGNLRGDDGEFFGVLNVGGHRGL